VSRADLELLLREVPANARLDAELREVADARAFAELLARAARERGLVVEESDVFEALHDARRAWHAVWP
jgi:glycine/D-amino acid oxidase-like deaminating enzyme